MLRPLVTLALAACGKGIKRRVPLIGNGVARRMESLHLQKGPKETTSEGAPLLSNGRTGEGPKRKEGPDRVKETMIITCPKCGEKVAVKGLGRKPLNIPLRNVYECLRRYRTVERAAQELGCSQGYIFNLLRANGLGLKDILPRHLDAVTERLSTALEDKRGSEEQSSNNEG